MDSTRSLLGLSLLCIAGLLVAMPQQQPPTPTPAPAPGPVGRGVPPIQQIDPPEPRPGDGVDLVVQTIDAITGKAVGDVKIELVRSGTAQDRRQGVTPGQPTHWAPRQSQT